MYLDFFGLQKQPFAMTPDPAILMLTPKHREALAGLIFAVNSGKGFVALTGDAGTGKTTLLRKMMGSQPPSKLQFSFVLNPTLTTSEFLESVLLDFGFVDIPVSKAQRLVRFQEFLIRSHAEGKISVLVVDEAHKLTPELLEEIRLLTNFETADQKLLQIILAGQSELIDLLNQQDLRQLKQRVAVWLGIAPIDESRVSEYIRIRWRCAGGGSSVPFSPAAAQLIAKWSRGIPRIINAICDNALTNAFGADVQTIDAPEILEVIRDLHLTDSLPARPVPAARPLLPPPPVEPIIRNGTAAAELSPILGSLERYMPAREREPLLMRWALKLGLKVSGG
ncbi:MAG TPA: AAA family ATPase [Bryobacteraceae bacterium]|nr:AAA family ATPase [Bryobacteraceae bacterium]